MAFAVVGRAAWIGIDLGKKVWGVGQPIIGEGEYEMKQNKMPESGVGRSRGKPHNRHTILYLFNTPI